MASQFEELITKQRVQAIHVLPSPYFEAQRTTLIELAAQYRLPACYEFRDYVQEGGLMSYGPSITEMFGRSASLVDRVLRGIQRSNFALLVTGSIAANAPAWLKRSAEMDIGMED